MNKHENILHEENLHENVLHGKSIHEKNLHEKNLHEKILNEKNLQEIAYELLASGQVSGVIGWGATPFAGETKPIYIQKAEDSQDLLFNEHCLNMLAKYALNKRGQGKIGLCTRGCESRAINLLLGEKQLQREDLYLIGLPCPGMKQADGTMAEKCRLCAYPNPLIYDKLLGEPVPQREQIPVCSGAEELTSLDADSRYAYWQRAFSRCLRCYACRNVCPACYCSACFVERHDMGWQSKRHNAVENSAFHLQRAFHLAGRCVECGECRRVCPMSLPLTLLQRRLLQVEREIFGIGDHGLSAGEEQLLGSYSPEDGDEFF